jgi:hypothetical protein
VTQSKSEAVYVGRDSFRMEVEKTPQPEHRFDTPVSGAFYPHGQPSRGLLLPPPTSAPRPPVQMVRALKISKSVFAGVCLTAFAAGIVTKVAIDSLLLRQGSESPVVTARAAASIPPPRPVTPEFQALPPPAAPARHAPQVEALPPAPQESREPAQAAATPLKKEAAPQQAKQQGSRRGNVQAQRVGRGKRASAVAEKAAPEQAGGWIDPFGQ